MPSKQKLLNVHSEQNRQKVFFFIMVVYMCSDCQYDKYAFFCFDCFDPKKHIGHHYYVTEGSGACDCKNKHLWNA